MRLSQVWAYSVANAPVIVLPVELKSFTTHLLPNNQQVAVNWETATEEQSDYFAIERQSEFDKSFKEIGRVKAAGNTSKKLIYNWLDERVLNGISYYRLRMVEKNGRESYSKTTSITYKNGSKVRIFPTFTEGEVFIETSGQPITETFVWNAWGLLLQHSRQTRLDLSALPAGFYLVQVKIGNEQFVEKIRRQ